MNHFVFLRQTSERNSTGFREVSRHLLVLMDLVAPQEELTTIASHVGLGGARAFQVGEQVRDHEDTAIVAVF